MLEKVKIGWKTYDIEKTDPEERLYVEGSECYGQICFAKRKIYLNDNFAEDQLESTLIHEILHGVDDMYDIGLEEDQVERLGKALYTVLKDNDLEIVEKKNGLTVKLDFDYEKFMNEGHKLIKDCIHADTGLKRRSDSED